MPQALILLYSVHCLIIKGYHKLWLPLRSEQDVTSTDITLICAYCLITMVASLLIQYALPVCEFLPPARIASRISWRLYVIGIQDGDNFLPIPIK